MHHKLCLSYILLVWNNLSNKCAGCVSGRCKVVKLSFDSTRDLVGSWLFSYNISISVSLWCMLGVGVEGWRCEGRTFYNKLIQVGQEVLMSLAPNELSRIFFFQTCTNYAAAVSCDSLCGCRTVFARQLVWVDDVCVDHIQSYVYCTYLL